MALEFPIAMLQTKRQWNNIFKIVKKREFQPRILYLAKLSNKRGIKTFLDMEGFKKFLCHFPQQDIETGSTKTRVNQERKTGVSK